jgi:hypothetical protein
MAEGKPEPEREYAILERMKSNRVRARCLRRDVNTRLREALCVQENAGACLRSPRGDTRKQGQHGTDGLIGGHNAKRLRRCRIAGERELEFRSRARRDRAQPDIGKKRIEIETASAVNDHRDLGRELKPACGDGFTERGSN